MKVYTIEGKFELMFDENGDAYIAQINKLIFVETGCIIKCFEDTKLRILNCDNGILF